MPRCVCAVLDYSEDYVKRFSGYIKKSGPLPFTLVAFTEKTALENFLKREKADLVLLPEKDPSGDLNLMAEGFRRLSKSDTEIAVLGDKRHDQGTLRYLNKYQSAEGIISEIIDCLSETDKFAEMPAADIKKVDIIGIYSFGHLDKAVNFAFNLAGRGSGQKKALYINLTRFSGLEERFEEPPEASFSDIIFYFRTGSEKIRGAYHKAKGKVDSIDVLTAPDDMNDLTLIGEEDLEGFFGRIAAVSGADTVIIDIGEAFGNLTAVMDVCSRICLLYDSKKDKNRRSAFRKYIENRNREDLLGKISETDISRI